MRDQFYLQITTRKWRKDGIQRQSKLVGRILRVKTLKQPRDMEDLPETKAWVVEVFMDEKGRRSSPVVCKALDCTDGYDKKTSREWVNAATNVHTHPFIVMKGNLYKTIEDAKEEAERMRIYYVK